MSEAGLAVVQAGSPQAPKKPEPKTEIEKLDVALKAVDSAIVTLKAAIADARKCKVPGMDVSKNLGTKLGVLLKETQLPIPRKGA